MRKFGSRAVLFTFLFLIYFSLLNIFFLGLIAFTDWNFIKRLESIRFNNPDYKLLILGNSLALDGIDAELLTSKGIKSYNLALDGSSVKTNYIQLSEYLSDYPVRPEYIVLGINANMESFVDEMIQPVVEVTMQKHHFSLNDLPVVKFKWLGLEFLKKVVSVKHRRATLSYGQVKFRKISPDNTNYVESPLNIQKFESSHWIGEIAKLCEQKSIELIVLEMPGFKKTQNISGTGPYMLHFKNGCSARLYNFNRKDFCSIFDSKSDWIGKSHLNESGAEKFSNELFNIIKE
jgi:hypothetical protein